jgi:hypothetical protein
MTTLKVQLTPKNTETAEDLAKQTGKTPEQLVNQAFERFAAEAETDEQRKFGEWRAALEGFEGMWEHRDDLPDFDVIRRSWDRNVWDGNR